MDNIIHITTMVIIISYILFSLWVIYKRYTILGSLASSIGLSCGGYVVVTLAESMATFVCWGIVATITLFFMSKLAD